MLTESLDTRLISRLLTPTGGHFPNSTPSTINLSFGHLFLFYVSVRCVPPPEFLVG